MTSGFEKSQSFNKEISLNEFKKIHNGYKVPWIIITFTKEL
jgi:hypothetical protein